MKQYAPARIRNVVLLSHGGAGKTSLAEALLFCAQATTRLGHVADGTTVSDSDPDEIRRGTSISTAVLPLAWRDTKINLLDAPGYSDFIGERKAATRAADAAVIVLCAASGVEVGTEQVWRDADEANLPRLLFVNKLEREHADFYATYVQARAVFGERVVALHLPIGTEASFAGHVDVLTRTAYDREGKPRDLPAAMTTAVDTARETLVEKIAETDDALIERFLSEQPITDEELRTALRAAVIAGSVVPLLVGAGACCAGVAPLLDAIVDYLPGADRPVEARSTADTRISLTIGAEEPVTALIFRTVADPFVGKLTYFRVITGTIHANGHLALPTRNTTEHLAQLYAISGKEQTLVGVVGPGDIGAVAKLTSAGTGDTLCHPTRPVMLDSIHFPEPTYTVAVRPQRKADLDKLGQSLHRLVEEDPTIHVGRDPATGDTLVSGTSDSHVQIVMDRMARKFGVQVDVELPVVPYRETVQGAAHVTSRHKKQTGGHGQFAEVVISIEPDADHDFAFADTVVGGTVPKHFIPAVEKGVREALHEGALAGFPMAHVKVTLSDGKYHAVDSSEMAFKIAGAQGFREAAQKAHPILLEPIYHLEITVPDSFTGDIMSDLNVKRGRVQGLNPDHGFTVIDADAPLAEVQRYATDLRSLTQGRGTFAMHFDHYEPVPAHLQDAVIKQSLARRDSLVAHAHAGH